MIRADSDQFMLGFSASDSAVDYLSRYSTHDSRCIALLNVSLPDEQLPVCSARAPHRSAPLPPCDQPTGSGDRFLLLLRRSRFNLILTLNRLHVQTFKQASVLYNLRRG